MEKIKVNMSPNPLDVQTIHASQNDSEAREWGFELHNNGDAIDSSSITDQLVFKACEGGTEEILPTNGSVPTTAPFLGDIRYPQGLLTDQEFTYRQSPTESDGLAKITDIKGNTIVWNQLVQNGNFADTSTWSAESGATLSISNNIATIASTTANNGIRQYFPNPLTVGHKYLIKAEFNVPTEYRCVIGTAANQGVQVDKLISTANTWTEVIGIGTCTVATTSFYCYVRGSTTYENVKVRNVMCVDLTEMFGAGNEPTTVEEFTSLFPLSYYSYNQGSLLSFNGNGIKTTGKNLYVGSPSFDDFVDRDTYTLADETYNGHEVIYKSEAWHGVCKNILVKANVTYTFSSMVKCSAPTIIRIYNKNADILEWKTIGTEWTRISATFTPSQDTVERLRVESNNTNTVYLSEYQLELGSSASEYEPYTENTLSLPISTYFPDGMKSAGSVYDELTPSKAINRIGAVDLGSLPLFYYTPPTSDKPIAQFSAILPNALSNVNTNVRCALYTSSSSPVYGREVDKTVCTFNGRVYICDSAYTDATAFKTAMSGVYLYYPLATPTETSFTTASLVTENAEIPLSNEDGILIGKCTEQLSENPGFFDAKIKLADDDGECYSNKLQLHVERSPQ